ncbi:MAG: tetraacyldisaccharide 4'-kinase [Steroidobacteraceae bacterium]
MPESGALRSWLQSKWYGPLPPPWLRPLAACYGWALALRRAAYRYGIFTSRHPGIPVVVVGNLTAGGTGKTPLVMWLAQRLTECGLRPGIVLRGYGGRSSGPRLLHAGATAADVGDEAVLLAAATGCPVAVGACRPDAADLLARAGCELVLADDGLQHLALRRDLAVVVVDGERGFGNGALLPAGPLREPAMRLAAADVVVVHGTDLHAVVAGGAALHMRLEPQPLQSLRGNRQRPLQALRGLRLHAVAGIGHPARFFAQLRALGASPIEHAFADHHRFQASDFAFGDGLDIVMTAKDAVKCRAFATDSMWCLPVSAQLPDPDAARLLHLVTALLSNRGARRA